MGAYRARSGLVVKLFVTIESYMHGERCTTIEVWCADSGIRIGQLRIIDGSDLQSQVASIDVDGSN